MLLKSFLAAVGLVFSGLFSVVHGQALPSKKPSLSSYPPPTEERRMPLSEAFVRPRERPFTRHCDGQDSAAAGGSYQQADAQRERPNGDVFCGHPPVFAMLIETSTNQRHVSVPSVQ
jgi:hypothetical protein